MPQVEDEKRPQLLAVVAPAVQVVVDQPGHRHPVEDTFAAMRSRKSTAASVP